MKALIAILILITFAGKAQILPADAIKPIAIKSGLLIVSGFADGTAEVLRINYNQFDKVFPNANQGYWNPDRSWTNKWKNGNPDDGDAYLFSSTALVWTTDAYHMARMVRNCTMITAMVIPIGKRKNWKQYVVEGSIYYLSYTAGFTLSYNGIFKMK